MTTTSPGSSPTPGPALESFGSGADCGPGLASPDSVTPGWALRGLPLWSLLITLPIVLSLLVEPLTDPIPGPDSVRAWLVAAVSAAGFVGVVLTRYRPEPRSKRIAHLLLVLMATLAIASTLAWSPAWRALFVLLVIACGIVMIDRTGPFWVLTIAVVATGTTLLGGAGADVALLNGLTVLLTGLGTYAIHYLIATVAELRRTRRELARLAVLQERDRFARDLHDLLGHTLSVIVVKAEAVRRLAPLDSAAAAVHAADIETIGREALADVRRAAEGYRGAGLDRELTRAQAALSAAGVSLALERPASEEPFPDDVDVLLGWAVREGVTNIVRHTRAQHCTITVRRLARSVEIVIEDDGTAKPLSPEPLATELPPSPGPTTHNPLPSLPPSPGSHTQPSPPVPPSPRSTAHIELPTMAPSSGLPGLGERVAAAGGTVTAAPTEQGFRITADVPLPRTR